MSAPSSSPPSLPEATPAGPPPGATADELEAHWLAHVYAGDDAPQLTLRAIVTGMLLGALMALSNLYVVLKTGWSLGVTVTAAVLAFAIWSLIRAVFRNTRLFGPLENNAMQSVASAAGYMTGGGTVAAMGALLVTTGQRMSPVWMTVWIGTLAFLGVVVAIPLKRQLINVEQLRFPTGLASAETVKSLHAGDGEARVSARAMGISGLIGVALALGRDLWHLFPDHLATFGRSAARYTIQLETSLILVGAGAITGVRVGLSQLLGALCCYALAAPWADGQGAIQHPLAYKTIVAWSIWFGASMMLTAGLTQFLLQWQAVKRSFGDLAQVFSRGAGTASGKMARVEVPMSWFVRGFLLLAPIAVFLQWYLFAIPLWMGCLALVLALVVALVSARSTGETDTTPTSAMGKLVQLIFGGLAPGNMTTNLMTAQASAGVALHASDLLTDLKSGHVLGARPRAQFAAQLFGVVAGSLVVVPVFAVLVPGTTIPDQFAAPSIRSWAAVAELLAKGMHMLHPTARWAIVLGAILGVVLALLERAFPRHRHLIPSPLAFGLAWTIPAWNSISMALGGLLAWAIEKKRPKLAAAMIVAVASGVIAGESIAGVFNGLWGALAK
jgi:OPT family oligopeptide transporter